MDRQDSYCFALPGEVYAIYLPEGRTAVLKLPEGDEYSLRWYDPVWGGGLSSGSVAKVPGSDWVEVGLPPFSDGRDWVLLVRKIQ